MKKNISIIGSTGSIGVQALKVIKADGHQVAALAAGSNVDLLARQALEHRPKLVAIFDETKESSLRTLLDGTGIIIASGQEGVCAAAAYTRADIVLNAAVGISGLRPTLAAIKAKKNLALANKESLVCAGELVMEAARANGVQILPVDSEHSAIFQCMRAGSRDEISRVIITASGGPFFGKTADEIYHMTPPEALRHPTWAMGSKITVDSATMMNKGFEMIEAMHLFGLQHMQVEAVIHRESVIHSLVEFCDGAVIAQLSPPDMGLAIQYAINWPRRFPTERERLDLVKLKSFTFAAPDEEAFPALALCRKAMVTGGTMGAAVNGADEEAVGLFLRGRIPFGEIAPMVKAAVAEVPFIPNPTIQQIFIADNLARKSVLARAARLESSVKGDKK